MSVSGTDRQDIARAVSVVRDGGIIAFPTETYYGLGVDPFNEDALAKLFALKKRPAVKPVLVLIADHHQIGSLVSVVPGKAALLMNGFWPGPLTLVLPAKPGLSPMLTGTTGTVGIRVSSHLLAQDLPNECGLPLTATSANLSGYSPAVTADEVYDIFGEEVDIILDGGRTPGRKGSTLVGIHDGAVHYIREGYVDFKEIRHFLQTAEKNQ